MSSSSLSDIDDFLWGGSIVIKLNTQPPSDRIGFFIDALVDTIASTFSISKLVCCARYHNFAYIELTILCYKVDAETIKCWFEQTRHRCRKESMFMKVFKYLFLFQPYPSCDIAIPEYQTVKVSDVNLYPTCAFEDDDWISLQRGIHARIELNHPRCDIYDVTF